MIRKLVAIACIAGATCAVAAGPTAPAVAASPAPVDSDPQAAKDTFEDYVLIEDWSLPLRLSGNAVVSRRYLPFYAVGLYVTKGPIDVDELANGLAPCRIAIHWLVPEINAADAQAYWQEQLARAAGDELAQQRLAGAFARIATAIGEAHRGEELLLDYHPDRGLRVWRDGKVRGQFAGLELNRTVLSLWIGAKAPSDLRKPLLGLANNLDATQ